MSIQETSKKMNETKHINTDTIQTENQSVSEHSYGQKYQDHLIQQYKLYVEMMDRTTARRIQVNNFYTSILSGLLALLAIVANKDIAQFKDTQFQLISLLLVAVLGIVLCLIWYINIQSYKQLNSGKFKVIHELENKLPFECYGREWELIKKDRRYQGYLTQTSIEKMVPFILSIPYFGLFIYSLINLK
ncbi:MAG: hypothetical protein QNJ49_07275 [Mastigocoleus sp. MO_167.B18]|nr:hypothetical protein [Mastigocoleus sp. MO_167.B18]